MDRRSLLKSASALLSAAVSAPILTTSAAAEDEILVASILDTSGGLDIYGQPMADCMSFAVDEQNEAGGLLGRKLRLVSYDPQSNMQLYSQFAQQAVMRDRVAVVHGGITSSSREVIRPVLDRLRTLYFYNTQYEGGVCDRNTFCTGVTPAQTAAKLVPFAMNKWGKKVYIVAADYNYGQITSQWVKKFAQENGGSVIATDFFPLDVTNFGPTISKIEAAKPDLVWSQLVGGSHISFYRQWAAAGLNRKIPLASTAFASGNEHVVLSPEECNGFLVAYNYFPNLDNPGNKAFKERYYKRYGAAATISELGMSTYQGFRLWAEGVRKAGSLDRQKVTEALESNLSIQAPSGRVAIDPSTHHCILSVSIAEVRDRQLEIVASFPDQQPLDTSAVCDLIKNPRDNKQYILKF